jgi:hypothetical protein
MSRCALRLARRGPWLSVDDGDEQDGEVLDVC